MLDDVAKVTRETVGRIGDQGRFASAKNVPSQNAGVLLDADEPQAIISTMIEQVCASWTMLFVVRASPMKPHLFTQASATSVIACFGAKLRSRRSALRVESDRRNAGRQVPKFFSRIRSRHSLMSSDWDRSKTRPHGVISLQGP